MAKKKIKTDGSGAGMANLFEMVEEVTIAKVDQPNYQLNTKPMSQRVREVVSEALKRMDCKRWEVAGRMSELCGVEITESMLNAWTAESKENHRFPLELVPAFCQVTGDYTLIEMTAFACGCMVVQSKDAFLLRMGQISQMKRTLSQQEGELRRRYEKLYGGKL